MLDNQAQTHDNKEADSLFKQRNFELAQEKYKTILYNETSRNPNIYLKLAYIDELNAHFPETLYYLNLYFNRFPDEKIFNKINTIAEANNYSGYEKNAINYIILLYRKYVNYFNFAFIIIGLYLFSVFFYKKTKLQPIGLHHKIFFSIYLLLLFLLINLPNYYRSVIIKNNPAILRNYPSAAAPIIGKITEGHRLNVLGAEDIWLRVYWEDKLVYIKATDVWILH